MFTFKHTYRIFENCRLVWLEAVATMPVDAADKPAEKPAENDSKKTEDKSKEIKRCRDEAHTRIETIKNITQPNLATAAVTVADALNKHADTKFDEISRDYNKEREKIGTPFETSDKFEEQREAIEKRAAELLKKIDERVGKKVRYVEYQARQEKIAAASSAQPGEAEKQKNEAKIGIISSYLAEAEETKGMDSKMRDTLARFIVAGNMVELNGGLESTYKDKIDEFFDHVDQSSEKIVSGELKDKLGDVVKMFLAESPNIDAKDKEKDLFKKWVLAEKSLKEKFGTDDGKDSYLTQAVTALAKRFDVRTKDGKEYDGKDLGYAVDLEEGADKAKVLDATKFGEKAMTALRAFTSEDDVSAYSKKIDDGNKELIINRTEIEEGMDWRTRGGKIDSWDDWKGHEAAETLMKINKTIKDKADPIVKTQVEEETQKEAIRKATVETNEHITAYNNLLTASNEHKVVEQAKNKTGFTDVLTESKTPNFKTDFDAVEVIENSEKGLKIKVTLNYQNGDNNLTVEIISTDKNPPFTIKQNYTPDQFKKLKNLAQMAENAKNNRVRNKEILLAIKNQVATLNNPKLDQLEVKFEPSSDKNAQALDGYKVPDTTLEYDGQPVGSLVFGTKDATIKPTVTVQIEGAKTQDVAVNGLRAYLQKSIPLMKKAAEQVKKNKTEVDAQLAKDLNLPLSFEGLRFEKTAPPTGDFTKANGEIKVGDFYKTADPTRVAATLLITAGREKVVQTAEKGKKATETFKPRKYTVVPDVGEKQTFDSMDEVRSYMNAVKAVLAKVEQKEETPARIELSNAAYQPLKDKLTKMVVEKIWGQMKGHEADTEFSNAITNFINDHLGKDTKRITELQNSSTLILTREEEAALKQCLVKEYKFDQMAGKEVDPKEVAAINALLVKTEAKEAKLEPFSNVFGPHLAKSLSMAGEFKKDDTTGKLMIQENPPVEATLTNLKKYVPTDLQSDYDKICKGEKVNDFEKKSEAKAKLDESMAAFAKLMKNPEKLAAFKNMGWSEMIASLGQLVSMLTEAMRTGDWTTFSDGIKDINEGKNPAEKIKKAKEKYTEATAKITSVGALLDLYNNPYGKEADRLFGTTNGGKPEPYRIELKHVIQARFENELDMKITKIKQETPTRTLIEAEKNGLKHNITVEQKGGETRVTAQRINVDSGKETVESLATNEKIINLAGTGADSMSRILGQKSTAGVTDKVPTAPAETPKLATQEWQNYLSKKAAYEAAKTAYEAGKSGADVSSLSAGLARAEAAMSQAKVIWETAEKKAEADAKKPVKQAPAKKKP